MRRTGLKNLQI